MWSMYACVSVPTVHVGHSSTHLAVVGRGHGLGGSTTLPWQHIEPNYQRGTKASSVHQLQLVHHIQQHQLPAWLYPECAVSILGCCWAWMSLDLSMCVWSLMCSSFSLMTQGDSLYLLRHSSWPLITHIHYGCYSSENGCRFVSREQLEFFEQTETTTCLGFPPVLPLYHCPWPCFWWNTHSFSFFIYSPLYLSSHSVCLLNSSCCFCPPWQAKRNLFGLFEVWSGASLPALPICTLCHPNLSNISLMHTTNMAQKTSTSC